MANHPGGWFVLVVPQALCVSSLEKQRFVGIGPSGVSIVSAQWIGKNGGIRSTHDDY